MFAESFNYKLIYIFEIRDNAHSGLLKIGETTINFSGDVENLSPNCKILNQAARMRIKTYTNTAGIDFNLLHTELAIDKNFETFRDYDVHRILINSNVEKKFPHGSTGKEWFKVDIETARQAIKAVKEGRKNLSGMIFDTENFIPITLRPEQENAVELTMKNFRREKNFLWNAKMRFGKTLTALELVRRMKFSKTIIITHRPVVDVGWYEDFQKIFHNNKNFLYGSKNTGYNVDELLNSGKNFVYFASMQDLRGSEKVGGKYSKNEKIFSADWDFVIVDEAHEGINTALGDKVINSVVKENTKFLALSGTPFNILNEYEEKIFTWDYIQEQRAKIDWDRNNFGDHNPYAELPKMNIFAYNLGELLKNSAYIELEDKAFNFREFFRTDEQENFIHEDDVKKFLDLLTEKNAVDYPFSKDEYRKIFRHSLWKIPGVKAGRALSKLLKNHAVFGNFEIVNVAGNGDADEESADALEKVQKAIKNFDYTITLTCGKLTAGVTVPEWTAVFMLAGSYTTSAASYMQTIFRVQSPCKKNGKSKENCFVFDFAPDRALKMIAEAAKISAKAGKTNDTDRKILGEFLNFCPIISVDGSQMKKLDENKLLQQLKKVYAEKVVLKGFDDTNLYNDELLKLNDADIKKFENLKAIIGSSKAQKKTADIEINSQGFTEEEYAEIQRIEKKPKRQRTPEEQSLLDKKQKRRDFISILRAISIRMPLLIYGDENVDIDDDFQIEQLLEIDDASWAEFMPAGVTKEIFKDFIKFYDKEIFVAAGHRIRNLARSADELNPTERVKKLAEIFSTFKNPDKETVLTPFRVVNLHLSSCLGGWDFFDEEHKFILDTPREIHSDIFSNTNAKILEINSKTGLYPLYVTYSIFRARLGEISENKIALDELQTIWDKTVRDNVFVICKTPMAKAITKRTLIGFRKSHVNAHYFDDLINQLKHKPDKFISQILNNSYWKKGAGTMKFDAVIGNPPYQDATKNTSDNPVYNYFIETSMQLADKVSLIHPARFLFHAGKTPKDFNERILNNKHIKIVRYESDCRKFFPTADIKGGIAITYYDAEKNFGAIGTFTPFPELNSILQKVVLDNKNFSPLSEIIFPPETFHFTKKFHEDNPTAKNILSAGHENDLTTNIFDKLPKIFLDKKPDDENNYIRIFGLSGKQRCYKWIRRDYIDNKTNLNFFKVFVPKSNGSGAIGEVVSTPLVGSPLVGSTQTFISVGAFDTAVEAGACLAYIKTKFCRAMLGILKVTQHNPPQTWAKVPLQDFTENSDIDWSKKIFEIDRQLYEKYKLTAEEINFIESKVKAME